MKHWKLPGLGLIAGLALAQSLHAQAPDVPAAPAAVPGAASAAAPKNLWSFLCPTPDQCAACKAKICNSPLGAMLKGAAGPLSAASGGLIGAGCGTPTAMDLAKMKADGTLDSAGGTAAQIKAEEADAKARRDAVRYLGTVDCNYFPKARDVLIKSLREDTNECVRYEAALALMRGCCCNEKTIEALKDSTNGGKKLGPRESSWRVREAAGEALAHCAEVYKDIKEASPVEPRKEKGKENGRDEEKISTPRISKQGGGLFGIIANASVPPKTIDPAAFVPPSTKEPMVQAQTPKVLAASYQNVPKMRETTTENIIYPTTPKSITVNNQPKIQTAPKTTDMNDDPILFPFVPNVVPMTFESTPKSSEAAKDVTLQSLAPKVIPANNQVMPKSVENSKEPIIQITAPGVVPAKNPTSPQTSDKNAETSTTRSSRANITMTPSAVAKMPEHAAVATVDTPATATLRRLLGTDSDDKTRPVSTRPSAVGAREINAAPTAPEANRTNPATVVPVHGFVTFDTAGER